jgi:hypothetical protein
MSPTTQLVNLFSPNPNDTHSGRTTPSNVGGATSDVSSVATVISSVAISFDTQPDLTHVIRPILHQGSLSVIDLDALTCKKVTGRGKGASTHTAVEHVVLLSLMSKNPDAFNSTESSTQ